MNEVEPENKSEKETNYSILKVNKGENKNSNCFDLFTLKLLNFFLATYNIKITFQEKNEEKNK